MFRLILNIEDVDYNTLIDMVSEMVKKNKDNPALKGMKIPSMGFAMVKNLPKAQKNEMLAMIVNQDKARTIQTLESVIAARVGAVRILNAVGSAITDGVQITVDVGAFDLASAVQMDKIVNGGVKKVYAFEPDSENYKRCFKNRWHNCNCWNRY